MPDQEHLLDLASPDADPLVLDRRWYKSLDAPSRAAVQHWLARHQLQVTSTDADPSWPVVSAITIRGDKAEVLARPAGAGKPVALDLDLDCSPLRQLVNGQPAPDVVSMFADRIVESARIVELTTLLEQASAALPPDSPLVPEIQTALEGGTQP